MRIGIVGVVLVTAFSFCAERRLEADEFWPGWLGPQRDGWVHGFQPPANWPKGLQPIWRKPVGVGYGSPLVADGRVFQHARQAEEEVVCCFDLTTGEQLWRQSYTTPFKMGGGGERHGKGPKSCPVYADGRLFTMSITGDLVAWDAKTGKQLWRSDYGKQFKKNHPYWGASASPIVDGKRVIVHFGNDERGALAALDVASGKEVWRQGEDGASYSSPLVAELGGVRQVIDWNHRALVGVESKSGKKLWEFPFPHIGHNQNMPTPAVHDGLILLGGENRGVVGLRPVREGERWSVKELWFQKKIALDMSSAIVNNAKLFGFSHYDSGRLFCLDIKTGEVLWRGPPRTGQNVTFLAVPDHILALIDNGELRVIAARGDRYQQLASYQVAKNESWAPPVLLKEGLLIKDLDALTYWRFAAQEGGQR